MRYYKYILPSILWCLSYSARSQDFVERKTDVMKPSQPTTGISLFKNENRACIFSYCWNKFAKCSGFISCCWCKCRENTPTFFSKSNGCLSANQLLSKSGPPDEQCNIFSKSIGYRDVPLFTNSSVKQAIELISHSSFSLNSNATCYAEKIYHYEFYSGTKNLLYHNQCEDVIKVRLNQDDSLMFYWGERATEEWDRMAGRLLAVDIHCHTLEFTDWYSSCFLFQVAGKSGKERLDPEPELPYNFTCPTEVPTTVITTTTKISSDVKPKVENNNTRVVVSVIVTSLIVVGIIILLFFLWKRRKAQRKLSEDTNRIIYDGQAMINTYEDQQLKRKSERENSLKKGEKEMLYVEVPEEQDYTAIDDAGHEYETPVKIVDMSKRPLPECPQHINNPYYLKPGLSPTNESRDSGDNQLYSIYDSIQNLKPST